MAGAASAHQAATATREDTSPQRAGRRRRSSADPQRAQQGATAAAAAAPAALQTLSRVQQLANASPQVAQLRRLQALADGRSAPVAQLAGGPEEEELIQGKFASPEHPAQLQQAPRANNTGLPDQLKSGIESLSGLSMDHVRVHYNSAQPAQLNALAYAQGSDIHLAPGQERHLPHEAWHVVQQAQGRVLPTLQLKDGVQVNDDAGLEREADMMGAKASRMPMRSIGNSQVSSHAQKYLHMVTEMQGETERAGTGVEGANRNVPLNCLSIEPATLSPKTNLHLAAHEAAHVMHQRTDAVADGVVARRSAVDLWPSASTCGPVRQTEPTVQLHRVLGPDKIYVAEPESRPWFGYPYAVAAGGNLVSQTPRPGVGGEHEFLDAQNSNTAWTTGAVDGFSLRVSDDNQMAVEDSELTNRQPKCFFATQAVVEASNLALQKVNSAFKMQSDGGTTVKILTGWYTDVTLHKVTPLFNDGDPDLAPQNCNAIAAKVMGGNPEWVGNLGGEKALTIAKLAAPIAALEYDRVFKDLSQGPEVLNLCINKIAEEYVVNRNSDVLRKQGANQHALPNVGEGFMIGTIGTGDDLSNGRARVRDYETNTDRELSWPYHFGGVVALSGEDRITLENYARGDNRANNADPRWYFQMYGTTRGQTFHEFHKAKLDYANPLTVKTQK